jgi:hypothetical protein
MVDVQKLRSRMVLKGYNQRSLAAEMTARGVKISENTLSAKMTGGSKFDTEDADVICEILELVEPADKAAIFLA